VNLPGCLAANHGWIPRLAGTVPVAADVGAD